MSNFPLDLALGKQASEWSANKLARALHYRDNRRSIGDSHRNLGQPGHAVIHGLSRLTLTLSRETLYKSAPVARLARATIIEMKRFFEILYQAWHSSRHPRASARANSFTASIANDREQ